MTDELKTLKDFDYSVVSTIGCRAYKGRVEDLKETTQKVSIDELRQEAIKWIKKIEKGYNLEELHIDCNENKGILSWIKHFFNIDESELK